MSDADHLGTFWEHVEELRKSLISVFIIISLGFVLAFIFYNPLFELLTYPLDLKNKKENIIQYQEIKRERIKNRGQTETIYQVDLGAKPIYYSENVKEIAPGSFLIPKDEYLDIERPFSNHKLVLFGPLDGISTILKICFWVAVIGTSPFWGWIVLQFLAPAIQVKERRILFPFLLASCGFITLGFAFAFFITIPCANQFFQSFNQNIGINLWSLSGYLDYTLFLLFSNGFAFELFAILIFMVHLGFISAESLSNKRRYAIVGSFILGAILTPPDILTQFMLALPLIFLYEIAILYARIRQRKRLKQNQFY